MNARNNEFSTPSKIFRAPLVAQFLESASISADELGSGTVNAMGLTGEALRARCACEKVLPRWLISWRTAVDLNPATNSRIGSLERRPRECFAGVFELLGAQKVLWRSYDLQSPSMCQRMKTFAIAVTRTRLTQNKQMLRKCGLAKRHPIVDAPNRQIAAQSKYEENL